MAKCGVRLGKVKDGDTGTSILSVLLSLAAQKRGIHHIHTAPTKLLFSHPSLARSLLLYPKYPSSSFIQPPCPPLPSPTQSHTIHSISWISGLICRGSRGPHCAGEAKAYQPVPCFITTITARSHTLPESHMAHTVFHWDLSHSLPLSPLPCSPFLPFSPGIRAPLPFLNVSV